MNRTALALCIVMALTATRSPAANVLNGCALNGKFWVFYSAGTNVGFTVTVTDTKSGLAAVYTNADLTAAPPLQDVDALPCL